MREHGHDPATRLIASIPLRLHIAETRDKAWDECEAGLHQVLNFYRMGMANEAVRRSMRAFTRDIMPAIAAW